jgi:alkanesulfonate monooxygenase SsuD/methylene tetrahydromethanopterin reductase-like flavin-dependent oxidoreductase (luciferase family)
VRRLWLGETVSFEGEFFRITNARIRPLPIQQPSIPLFIGGVSAPGFRRAARYGDGFSGPVEYFPDYLAAVRAAGKPDAAARIQSLSASDMWFFVSDDPERALEEVAPHAYYQLNTYAEWQKDAGWGGVKRMEFDEFKKSGMVKTFTPPQAIDYIRSRRQAAPIEAFCMQAPAGLPLPQYARYVETFAKEVLPAFR